MTMYGTADPPGFQVGGVLFAGGGRVRCLDGLCGAGRRRWVEELMRNASTFEFCGVYSSADELSSEGFGGSGGPSGRQSECFPGSSHAAGTSGDPAISGSLPGDRVRSSIPGTTTPAQEMRIPDLCTCLCTELSETIETGCDACDVANRRIPPDLCI